MLSLKSNKDLRHNYVVNLLDAAFFGFGIGFASFSTILPLFISTLTDSALLIGLIPAIHNTGIQLPQIFTARSLNKVKRFLPPVMKATIHERLPFLGLALTSLLLPVIGRPAALILAFGCLIWQGLGAGFTANAWQNMLGRVIPSDFLATFFGLQAAASNLLASGAAVAAGVILERLASPADFTINFTACFILMLGSYYFLGLTHEPDREIKLPPAAQTSLSSSVKGCPAQRSPFSLVPGHPQSFPILYHGLRLLYCLCSSPSRNGRGCRRCDDRRAFNLTNPGQSFNGLAGRSLGAPESIHHGRHRCLPFRFSGIRAARSKFLLRRIHPGGDGQHHLLDNWNGLYVGLWYGR